MTEPAKNDTGSVWAAPGAGRGGRADVGVGGRAHADEPGEAGRDRTDRKGQGGLPTQADPQQHDEDDADDREKLELPAMNVIAPM